jgi:hypothetical protein
MRKFAWLAAFVMVVSSLALAGHEVPVLDGTSWKLEVEPDSMAKEKGAEQFKPTMTFADGKVSLTDSRGAFDASPYVAEKSDKKEVTFKTEQKNSTEGTSVWTGTVHENTIEGKRIWTKLNGEVWTYTFKGEKKDWTNLRPGLLGDGR